MRTTRLRHTQSLRKDAQGMEVQIEVRSKFEDNIKNPIELLKAVRQHSMNYHEH
jgi:hypothetical protein